MRYTTLRPAALPALLLATLLAGASSHAEVKPLPKSQWPRTVAAAVPHIVGKLTPTQRSIISNTSRDNLFLFLGEWGEDIEELLGLNTGNTELLNSSCGQPCSAEQAALRLMEASWESLQ